MKTFKGVEVDSFNGQLIGVFPGDRLPRGFKAAIKRGEIFENSTGTNFIVARNTPVKDTPCQDSCGCGLHPVTFTPEFLARREELKPVWAAKRAERLANPRNQDRGRPAGRVRNH